MILPSSFIGSPQAKPSGGCCGLVPLGRNSVNVADIDDCLLRRNSVGLFLSFSSAASAVSSASAAVVGGSVGDVVAEFDGDGGGETSITAASSCAAVWPSVTDGLLCRLLCSDLGGVARLFRRCALGDVCSDSVPACGACCCVDASDFAGTTMSAALRRPSALADRRWPLLLCRASGGGDGGGLGRWVLMSGDVSSVASSAGNAVSDESDAVGVYRDRPGDATTVGDGDGEADDEEEAPPQ